MAKKILFHTIQPTGPLPLIHQVGWINGFRRFVSCLPVVFHSTSHGPGNFFIRANCSKHNCNKLSVFFQHLSSLCVSSKCVCTRQLGNGLKMILHKLTGMGRIFQTENPQVNGNEARKGAGRYRFQSRLSSGLVQVRVQVPGFRG